MVQNGQIFKVCLSSLFHQNEVGNLRLNMKLFSIWYLCAKIIQSQNELRPGGKPSTWFPPGDDSESVRRTYRHLLWHTNILCISKSGLPTINVLGTGLIICFSNVIFQFSNDYNFHHTSLLRASLSFRESSILRLSICDKRLLPNLIVPYDGQIISFKNDFSNFKWL